MVHSWLERMRKEEEEGGSDGYVLPTPIKDLVSNAPPAPRTPQYIDVVRDYLGDLDETSMNLTVPEHPVTVNRIAQAYGAVVSVSSLPEQASPVWRLWA